MSSSTSSSRRSITPADVDALRSLLAGTIRRWSRAAEKPAGVVLVPTAVEQVAVAVKYASENNIDLAVKGGGHSTAGVSSTDGGLLVDLNAKLRGVTVDVDKKLLKVQGGATWADVDAAGVKHGLATVGGTVADTGVGGLVLGGGYGWLSGQRGLAIDNLVEATVVLASGEIVKASEQDNTDLFWALRGAGQNFGVVTEFVLRAFDQGDVWAGIQIYPPTPENITKIVNATNELYQPDANGKTKLLGRGAGGISFGRPPPAGGQVVIIVAIIYFGTEHEAKSVFKPFYDLTPLVDTTALVPYPNINTLLAPPIGFRASLKGLAFALPIRPGFVQEVLENYVEFTDKNEDARTSVIMWELFDPAKVVSSDTGSFANRGWVLNGIALPLWTAAENDQAYRQWARDVNELFKKELEAQQKLNGDAKGDAGPRSGKGAVLLYGNYDQYDERSKDIFGENYSRLQSLKARYDPKNVFNKLFAVTPQA
ncbi:hypothetical protein DV735_g2112, partial [Chaetothyriales sp. CBS 134920]